MDPASTFFHISVGVSFWVISTLVIVVSIYLVSVLRTLNLLLKDFQESMTNIKDLRNILVMPLAKLIEQLITFRMKGGEKHVK